MGGVTLRECPFCGAQPMENAIEPHTHSPFLKSLGIPDHGGSHVVECGCGAGLIDDTREAVLARWNRRAAPVPGAGMMIKAEGLEFNFPERISK